MKTQKLESKPELLTIPEREIVEFWFKAVSKQFGDLTNKGAAALYRTPGVKQGLDGLT
jgi:hypothetical protein